MRLIIRIFVSALVFLAIHNFALVLYDRRSIRRLGSQGVVDELRQRRVVVVSVWNRYAKLLRPHTASVRAFLSNKAHPNVEVVVVNNAGDVTNQEQIRTVAQQLDVHHIQIPDAFSYEGSPSNSHAHALDTALDILLNGNLILAPSFPQQFDMLLIIDSDMFFMDKTNLLHELQGASVTSPLQRREYAHPYPESTYLWPNLMLFSFGEWYERFPQSRALIEMFQSEPTYKKLYRELLFGQCAPRPCFNCDSGGCTKSFLLNHRDLLVHDWGFEHQNETCSGIEDSQSSSACLYWKKQSMDLRDGCAEPTLSGPIYHIGSAGSNWRGCSEEWLEEKRVDISTHLRTIVPQQIAETHFD